MVIFQICYYIIFNGRKKTPLHVSLTQSIHEICRSKQLIELLNRMGICMSYDEAERQNYSFCARILEKGGNEHVPLPRSIIPNVLVQGAMDNFDHEENTMSGIGGTHDTVMVLFQHNEVPSLSSSVSLKGDFGFDYRQRALDYTLNCQNLIKCHNNGRGNIPDSFTPASRQDSEKQLEIPNLRYLFFLLSRFISKETFPENDVNEQSNLPSWNATNSARITKNPTKTSIGFTPLLPYPATEYDTIFTCMINFQDVLLQTSNESGALWCDEGVYRLAKEIQFLFCGKFDNIFLGLGGFHMEKTVIACLGKYLEGSGADSILVNNEFFGSIVVKNVLDGGHYVRGIRGMSILSEVMHRLLFKSFFKHHYLSEYPELILFVRKLQNQFLEDIDSTEINSTFEDVISALNGFRNDFNRFKEKGAELSDPFKYWNIFLGDLYPVLRNLTLSLREGDWNHYVAALKETLPLFFAFDRTNYSRWGAIFYEDCLKLPIDYPNIYSEYIKGNFVVNFTSRKGSSVPLDQALEKSYNKTAKGKSGIIGLTRKKASVAQHDIIHHEKIQIINFLLEVCDLNYESEYDLHHEFSATVTERDKQFVKKIFDYIEEKKNPFDLEETRELRNIITGTHFSDEKITFYSECLNIGRESYLNFVRKRLEEKTEKLFDKIPKNSKRKKKKTVKRDSKKDFAQLSKHIDIGRARNYDIHKLLSFELIDTSLFLTTDGFLSKPVKSELTREIEKLVRDIPRVSRCPIAIETLKEMTIIDFMAYARKVPIKGLKMKTFGEVASFIGAAFDRLSRSSIRLDVIFDLYLQTSTKSWERMRRCKIDPIDTFIADSSTPIPTEIDRFWSSSKNKGRFQSFFIEWYTANNSKSIPIYFGGSHKEGIFKCFVRKADGIVEEDLSLFNEYEEADNRLLFHITQSVRDHGYNRVKVVTSDTDIFINLIHQYHNWQVLGLKELSITYGSGSNIRTIQVDTVADALPSQLPLILPAIHALSGCDSTSKICTKLSALKSACSKNSQLLETFHKQPFTESKAKNAEFFLVKCLYPNLKADTFDELRYKIYHSKSTKMDMNKFPCTSESLNLHIRRAYYQVLEWNCAPYQSKFHLNPLEFGYCLEDDLYQPIVVSNKNIFPDDFPSPCSCVKCARDKSCRCRFSGISCSEFCKCCGNNPCRNPFNK